MFDAPTLSLKNRESRFDRRLSIFSKMWSTGPGGNNNTKVVWPFRLANVFLTDFPRFVVLHELPTDHFVLPSTIPWIVWPYTSANLHCCLMIGERRSIQGFPLDPESENNISEHLVHTFEGLGASAISPLFLPDLPPSPPPPPSYTNCSDGQAEYFFLFIPKPTPRPISIKTFGLLKEITPQKANVASQKT
jgi:hypothetical protein